MGASSADGQRAGVQADKVRGTTQMTLDEAQKILDVHPGAPLAEMRRVRLWQSTAPQKALCHCIRYAERCAWQLYIALLVCTMPS